jgi:hypothetical protein
MSGVASTFLHHIIKSKQLILWSYRWAFNLTLFITGALATAAGGSPGSIALCSLAAAWSIGVGGNLPVDSAVFLGMRFPLVW